MHNLKINKNNLNVQINSEINSKVEGKSFSRRLFIKIFLMILSVVSSTDNFKTNKNELNKEITPKKVKFMVRASKPDGSSEGSDKPSPKGKNGSNGSDPGGSDKPSPKGKRGTKRQTKPSDPAPKGGSSNPGG